MHRKSRTESNVVSTSIIPEHAKKLTGILRDRTADRTQPEADTGNGSGPAISFSLRGPFKNSHWFSKRLPVTEVGQDYLAFLSDSPVRVHSRVSLRYYCSPDSEISESLEGRVIACRAGKYASPFRFCVFVLLDPLFVNRKFPYSGVGNDLVEFNGLLQFAA